MAAITNKFFLFIPKNYAFLRLLSTRQSIYQVLCEGQSSQRKKIEGWVSSIRKMKDVVFVDVNDGSCAKNLQVVISKAKRPSDLSYGSSLQVVGTLNTNPTGQLELNAEEMTIIGGNDTLKFPFSPKQKHSHDYCRQYLSYRPRLPHFQSLLRIRHRAMQSMHRWFDSQGFLGIHTPILTSNDCEGAGEIFKVLPVSQSLINEMKKPTQSDSDGFFGNPAYLSVSGQLHLEAITRGITKCYAISPTFRAENSKSRLHLSEFYMVESEEAFVTDIEQLLVTIESFVRDTLLDIVSTCRPDLERICKYDNIDAEAHIKNLQDFANKAFIRMSFEEACGIVDKHKDRFQSGFDGNGFSKEHELFLVEYLDNTPVFVVDWPSRIKPFYMKTSKGNPNLVSAVDLLVPNVGELCGGSLREDSVELLTKKLLDHQILDSMQWYVDLRRYGNVPTGGFGLGFERFLQLVTGLTNIKDTLPFPRWPHSLKL